MYIGASYRMFGSLNLDYRHSNEEIVGTQDLNGMIYSVGFSFGIY